ncbi:Translocation protein S62 [Binucleata daphniae]
MLHKISEKEILKIIDSVPKEIKIVNDAKRVQVFKGKDAVENLKTRVDEKEIKNIMDTLLKNNTIIKTIVKGNDCTMSVQRSFKEDDTYIFMKESSMILNLMISLGAIAVVLGLAMYQMWPKSVRGYTIYVAYLMIAFLVFIMVLGVIRLILFCITFFSNPPGIWLFPNLFADVGFVESFIPVWSYHGVDVKPKKKDA